MPAPTWTVVAGFAAATVVTSFMYKILKNLVKICYNAYQFIVFIAKMSMILAKHLGKDIPDWMKEEFREINGNKDFPIEQIKDLYGMNSGEKDDAKSASRSS